MSGSMSKSGRDRFMKVLAEGVAENSQDGMMADIDIIVEGKKFPCHRIILASFSPYFKAMFTSGMMESRDRSLTIPGIGKEIFEEVKNCIYGMKYNIHTENVMELLNAAALFQLIELQEECGMVLASEMNMENCLELFKIARSINCQILLDKCRPFVMEGFNGLWKSQEFETLELEDIESIVRDDDLVPVDEEQICEAVLKWIVAESGTRQKYLSRLFRHIRLVNVRPEYLIDELYRSELLLGDDDCRHYLDEARDYNLLPARHHEFASKRFHLRNSDDFEEVILVLTEYDMERSGSFYQDGKCLWAYSHHQSRWYTLSAVPLQQNPGLEFCMVNYRKDLYLSGGSASASKTMLRYDSERNEFSPCSDSTMKRGRTKHIMIAAGEWVYVIGGCNPKLSDGNQVLGSIEEYSIIGRKWRTICELSIPVHGAVAAAAGCNIFVIGGKKQDGSYYNGVQVFNVRHREVEEYDNILGSMVQPLKIVTVDGRMTVFAANGEVFDFRYKKVGSMKFKTVKRLQPDCLPLLGVTHYRGYYMLLVGGKSNPEVFSSMHRLDLKSSPTRVDVVIPKQKTKPKPIHAVLHGIVNKQFMYHTYFQ